MDDMVFAMTLAPWPLVLYHGTDRDEVEVRGLKRLAAVGFQKPKPYFAGTVGELEEQNKSVASPTRSYEHICSGVCLRLPLRESGHVINMGRLQGQERPWRCP